LRVDSICSTFYFDIMTLVERVPSPSETSHERAIAIYQEIRDIRLQVPPHLDRINPKFRFWVESTGKIDQAMCLAIIIATGNASDLPTAYQYLNDHINSTDPGENPTVVITDTEGSHWPHKKTEIRTIFGEHIGGYRGEVVARHFGTIGHRAIPELITGKLYDLHPFQAENIGQLVIKAQENPYMAFPPYLGDIKRLNKILVRRAKKNDWVITKEDIPVIAELEQMLGPIFNNNRTYDEHGQVKNSGYMDLLGGMPAIGVQNYALTLMTWASALEYAAKQPKKTLFVEKAILPFKHPVWAGRSDAIEVISINGHSPTLKETNILERLTSHKFESLVDVVDVLLSTFGSDIRLKNIDWKMAIGDRDDKPGQPITSDRVPLKSHIRKTHRYLTFESAAYFLATGRATTEDWLKMKRTIVNRADIVYFLPGQPPITIPVNFSLEEQKRFFRDFFARKFNNSKIRAAARVAGNRVMSHAAALISGNPDQVRQRKLVEIPPFYTIEMPLYAELNPSDKTTLFDETTPSMARIAEETAISEMDDLEPQEMPLFDDLFDTPDPRSNEFLENQSGSIIIPSFYEKSGGKGSSHETVVYSIREYDYANHDNTLFNVNKRDGTSFEMIHYENTLKSIKSGNRKAKNFTAERGGLTQCFDPDHNDKSPSCLAQPNKRLAHCWSCGKTWRIAKETIPENLDIKFEERSHSSTIRGEHGELLVPEDYQVIMKDLGGIMQQAFKGSPAELYVVQNRKIESELAIAYGAGYATIRTIIELIKSGYSFDQLKAAGLFGASLSKYRPGSVVKLFINHGMQEKDLRDEDGKYPYFILDNRATFPLTIEDITTSYYGRDLGKVEGFEHAKLLTRYSGVPQVGFNIDVLFSGYDDVKLTEGIFDALTLISMGLPAMAFVGIHNKNTVLEIVRSQIARIGIALDQDERGIKAALKLIEWLRNSQFPGEIYNYTDEFLRIYPSARRVDDINKTWVKGLYKQFQRAA
jgi:hypothetical protein